MNKKERALLITGITFTLFMVEAMIHFNMGEKENDKNHKFELPGTEDLIEIGIIVGVFSILNGIIISKIEK